MFTVTFNYLDNTCSLLHVVDAGGKLDYCQSKRREIIKSVFMFVLSSTSFKIKQEIGDWECIVIHGIDRKYAVLLFLLLNCFELIRLWGFVHIAQPFDSKRRHDCNNFVHTWKSLSAFTSPPTSFLREKMIVALPFSDVFFFSVFSSILLKVDLFNWKQ